ncbi:hypothetical protein ACLOJK_013219 [Asimina triloba]
MASSAALELCPQQELNVESGRRPETAGLVLKSPEPASAWQELVLSVKKAVFPQRHTSSSSLKQPASKRVVSALQTVFPFLSWGRTYNRQKLRGDVLAGLTLASLSIPQGIGYASLAKLDPQYGLCEYLVLTFPDTSVVPPLIYAVMGSSREIAIGPVAVVSLLLSSLLQKLVDPSSDPLSYRKMAFTATFFAGIFQSAFGLFRLGFLVDFLSHAAIVGFMGGAAIVIGLQQLKGLLGISKFTNKTDVISVMKAVWNSVQHHGRRNKKFFWLPAIAPLVSVILSTLLVFLTRADKHGIKIIKHFKGGLNPSSVHQLRLTEPYVGEAAKIGLICAVIALTEAMAIGRSFASMKGYHLDGNKEMVAMGCMNIVGSLSSCYVATGSFSRTAVNVGAGCQTAVSNIVMAITVFVSLELLTSLLYFTPTAILASIILASLPGLIDIGEACNIWKVDKLDFLVCLGAFVGVLFGSVEIGLLTAGTDIFCSIKQYPVAFGDPGLLITRIDSGYLCFINANFIRERINGWVNRKQGEILDGERRIQAVIIDMSSEFLNPNPTSLAIVNPGWQVIHKLKLSKFVNEIGAEWIFLTVQEAVNACIGIDKASVKC